ncbi:MAG: hypothetical protein ACOYCA_04815 [Eggerthellaceae bacterium]|jgi:AcrR family transcriptional regulator
MYHIKNDARSLKSAELFYRGLLRCLADEPLDKISVTDVQRASGAGRSTFYRNFDAVIDILQWKCDSQFAEAINGYAASVDEGKSEDLLLYMLRYWMDRADVIEALLAAGRVDVVYRSFLDSRRVVQAHLDARGAFAHDERFDRYFSAVSAGMFLSIMDAWVAGDKKESPEQVAKLVQVQGKYLVAMA